MWRHRAKCEKHNFIINSVWVLPRVFHSYMLLWCLQDIGTLLYIISYTKEYIAYIETRLNASSKKFSQKHKLK